jgi:hypothetical protein
MTLLVVAEIFCFFEIGAFLSSSRLMGRLMAESG